MGIALQSGVALFVVAVLGWAAQQFFGGMITALAERAAGLLFRQRGGISRRETRTYARRITQDDCGHPLGFLQVSIDITKVYVPLQHEVEGVRRDLYKEVRGRNRTVLLGGAGAGKSMFLRNGIVEWARDPARFDRIPVLVELHLYNDERKDLRALVVDKLSRRGIAGDRAAAILDQLLESGTLSLLLDGLDEVVAARRGPLVAEIISLAETHPDAQVVVSCRDAVYDDALGRIFEPVLTVAGFDEASMRRFLRLWFTAHTTLDARTQVEQIVSDLRKNPPIMRLAENPLMLTMIASLDADDPGAGPSIGRSRADFYKTAIDHMLRRDTQVQRFHTLTTYRGSHKHRALCAIASAAQGETDGSTFDRGIPEHAALRHCAKTLEHVRMDPAANAGPMLEEIIVRSELLSRVDDDTVIFPHLTIQEYLAAVQLGDDPARLLQLYRANPDRWREVVKLWCGADRDVTRVVAHLFSAGDPHRLLALECLADARQVDNAIATTVIGYFRTALLHPASSTTAVVTAFGALAAESSERGDAVFAYLRDSARREPYRANSAAVRALAASRSARAAAVIAELPGWAARVALRSIGEPAIPFLRDRAGAGNPEPVDDLAVIGTPAAALALATLLREDSPVAFRAAWRLAVLLAEPDVEEHLNAHEVDLAGVERLDWVPLRLRLPVDAVIARVAYLIEASEFGDIPNDIDRIDPRLALPLVADGSILVHAADSDTRQVDDLAHEIEYRRPLRHSGEPALHIRGLLRQAIDTDRAASAVALCEDLLASRVPTRRLRLWRMLTPALGVAVVSELVSAGLGRTSALTADNWRRLADPPPSPFLLSARRWVNGVAFVVVLLAGCVQCGATIVRWPGAWGPAWSSGCTRSRNGGPPARRHRRW